MISINEEKATAFIKHLKESRDELPEPIDTGFIEDGDCVMGMMISLGTHIDGLIDELEGLMEDRIHDQKIYDKRKHKH
jgi:hypothetical protein